MATEIQRERLRGDLDADEAALTDAEIDDAFARAVEQHGDGSQASFAVEAAARVIAIGQLLAGASKRADTSQNESAEKRSQVFDHLLRLRAIYEGDVKAASDSAVGFGGLRRKPTRIEAYPDA
jgi:hypothetical protein